MSDRVDNELAMLLRHTRRRPSSRACIDHHDHRWWTWADLAIEVWRYAVAPIPGTSKDSGTPARWVHLCENAVSDLAVSLACTATGRVDVPIDRRLHPRQRHRLEEVVGPIVDIRPAHPMDSLDEAVDGLTELEHSIDADADSLILWTSGTTAHPRGVRLSQRNLTSNARGKLVAVPQGCTDRRSTVLPICHAYARTCDVGTWLVSGGQLSLGLGCRELPTGDGPFRPTHINTVPSIARAIAEAIRSGDSAWRDLRVLGCGGAAIPQGLLDQFADFNIDVIQGYGLTETSPVISSARVRPRSAWRTPRRAGTVGPPIPDCQIKTAEQRLLVRGPNVMNGYLDEPVATRERIDENGWLDTGDLVEIDSDGELRILGRSDDVIVMPNGYKVHPHAIESLVQAVDGVEHAVVVRNGDQLLVAVQGDRRRQERIEQVGSSAIPPGTRLGIAWIDPPLEGEELTIKETPRREVVARRFQTPSNRDEP
ncbi:MAG: AMP-binding protein [Planctomycetota bacterium]